MKFQFSDSKLANGSVVYLPEERAFQTRPTPPHAGSIQVNEIELLIAISGRIVGLSGFCPHDGWVRTALQFPPSNPGAVHCPDGLDVDGIPIRFNKDGRWNVYYDSDKEVVCISSKTPAAATTTVEILQGLALGLEEGHLAQIWVRLPSIAAANSERVPATTFLE